MKLCAHGMWRTFKLNPNSAGSRRRVPVEDDVDDLCLSTWIRMQVERLLLLPGGRRLAGCTPIAVDVTTRAEHVQLVGTSGNVRRTT